ncbi:MFS transporter [Pontibacter akesuensis]|uniref:MFS transporter, ACS family, hexuronate transporter n=1 Tax=Pontibacter akesuensis TaxID=388950 RepID=A0A1I7JZB1_9BACT|nr:MFS transporter [Pontibacter akesuensis]GHA76338.1 hexuronate transporter [Pontibacter akesuensis]SFU90507.1 MFS transporter, ACS family, hexuronate transporter [Pontibacter akesuensis]
MSAPLTTEPATERVKIGSYRWTICFLLFTATTINYLDRQVVGILKPVLEEQFSWTESDYAAIVTAFTASYALGMVVFGRIIDKIGTKMGYSLSIVVWSLAAMGHAIARTTFGFGVARAALGVGESGNFPAAIKAVAEWFPKKERALATGLFNSGANVGAIAAPLLVPWIVVNYGWEEAFIITGAVGFIWLIFWLIFYEIPSKQKRLGKGEFDYIHSDHDEAPAEDNEKPLKWGKLLFIRQTWVFIVGKFFTDPIWYFFLFWLPSYFSSTFELNLSSLGLPLAIVYTATTVGSIGGGYLSSYLIRKGMPVVRARKTAMLIIALLVVPIMLARYTSNMWVAVGLISLAAAAHQAWSANIFTTVSDMFPKRAVSSVVGIGGMAGSIGGALFPLFIGAVLDYYINLGNLGAGYNIIFTVCAFAYLLAWVLMHFLTPREKLVQL